MFPPKKWDAEKSGEWKVENIDITQNTLVKKYNLMPVHAAWRKSFEGNNFNLGNGVDQTFTSQNLSALLKSAPSRFAKAIQNVLTDKSPPLVHQITCMIQPLQAAPKNKVVASYIFRCKNLEPNGISRAQILGGYIHPTSSDILVKTLLHESRLATSETFDFIPNPDSQHSP